MSFQDVFKALTADVSADLAKLARRENQRIMEQDPRPIGFEKWVDGSKGAEEESVKTGGVIVYEYDRYDIVAKHAQQFLAEISPEASGRFKRSWQILFNGSPVAAITSFKDGDEILIVNDQPYSRKIVSGHMKLSVPHNLTERAQREINGRFGNTVRAQATFMPLAGGYVLKGRFTKGVRENSRTKLQKDTKAGAVMTYPALRIVGR